MPASTMQPQGHAHGQQQLPVPRGVPTSERGYTPPNDRDGSRSDYARRTSHSRSDTASIAQSSVSSRRVPFPDATAGPSATPPDPHSGGDGDSSSTGSISGARSRSVGRNGSGAAPQPIPYNPVPVEPLPDSLLCRSTFAALEHSAGTLKRLVKTVSDRTAAVVALLEQLETAEDDMLAGLGELGRWLEGGYDVHGDVWEDSVGMRKVAREKRRREREELEVMVLHPLDAVKGEIKRQGLAANGAQARFEAVAKQYYAQTATYLGASAEGSADKAQAARQAQFDLMRYNHHSTLLYAVPPSSVGCLDLLVGLYGWVGAQLSQSPGKRADTHPVLLEDDFAPREAGATGIETPTQRGRALAVSETPVRLLLRDDASLRGSQEALSRTLALSLADLVNVRHELLTGWAERDYQTTLLEDNVKRLAAFVPEPSAVPTVPETAGAAGSNAGRDAKPKKKIGGKIRGLFGSSSNQAPHMPTLAERAPPVSSAHLHNIASRKSTDARGLGMDHPAPSRSPRTSPRTQQNTALPTPTAAFPMPPPRSTRPDARASIDTRTSMPASRDRAPFVPVDAQRSPAPNRASALADTAAKLNGVQVGGVGGLDGTEDERELVGRKKEGVLWGTGSWDALGKDSARSKWERFWVVLANSNLYEHRDIGPGKPESSATVIDLKFASVREGRGTDRRFVFEVVTPSHGRRLYQATSDAEMKTWIYTICNAIESCINGTSTMRSGDLRAAVAGLSENTTAPSASERSDRRRSIPNAVNPNAAATTSTAAKHKSTPVARHSMPPPPRGESSTSEPRKRRTSFKNRLRQGAEIAGDKISSAVNPAKRPSIEIERPSFLAVGGRMPSHPSLKGRRGSWYDGEDDGGPDAVDGNTSTPSPSKPGDTLEVAPTSELPFQRASHGALQTSELPVPAKLDMKLLRGIAATGANQRCADCGRVTKTSRWATLSLRDVPMVMFLCIRCCGLHRGLGTHISKPRSVDLDNWSPDAVLLAYQWGNERGNQIWERNKPEGLVPSDEDISEYIQAKYVEGRWLADADRAVFGL